MQKQIRFFFLNSNYLASPLSCMRMKTKPNRKGILSDRRYVFSLEGFTNNQNNDSKRMKINSVLVNDCSLIATLSCLIVGV